MDCVLEVTRGALPRLLRRFREHQCSLPDNSRVLVEAWNQMATVADQVQKGMQIQVQGKFKVNNYTDPNNTIHRNFSVRLQRLRRMGLGVAWSLFSCMDLFRGVDASPSLTAFASTSQVVAFSLSQVRRTEGGKAREDGGFAAAGGDRAPKVTERAMAGHWTNAAPPTHLARPFSAGRPQSRGDQGADGERVDALL